MHALRSWKAVVALLAVVGAGMGATSAAAAADAATVAAPAPARVIVTYRADARLLREHPAGGLDSRERVRERFQARAAVLSRRAGLPLHSGRPVGSRSQVLIAPGVEPRTLMARLSADPDVERVEIDHRRRALFVPNDPLYAAGPAVDLTRQQGGPEAGQWYLRRPDALFRSAINAESAWDRTRGLPSVVVAVLDTGVRVDHVDLQGQLLGGYDFVSNDEYGNDGDAGRDADASDPGDWITAAENASGTFRDCGVGDSSWHGTKVSGIIGAATNNGLGMAGVAPGVRILPVRVLGKCGGFDSDIAAGMRWAAGIDQPGLPGSATPARVLNLSLGGEGACTATYRSAVDEVVARGSVVVAAAGNSVGKAVGTPANCPGVVAVAGLRHAGTKVGFSDLGPEIAIAAPGGNCVNIRPGSACLYPILTTTNRGVTTPLAGGSSYTDSFNISVGTSFAAPMVAGAAALMLSARPQLTPSEVRQALQASARPFPTDGADNGPDDPTAVPMCQAPGTADQLQCYCRTGLCGAGMLDADAAVAQVQNGLFARIEATPQAPVAGGALSLSAAASLVGPGRSIVAWSWALVDGGGSVTGFSSATNAATATLQPTAAGTVVVRLTVTDDLGARASTESRLTVVAAPVNVVTPPANPGGGSAGGSGGGAAGAGWLLLLAMAAAALGRPVRPTRRDTHRTSG